MTNDNKGPGKYLRMGTPAADVWRKFELKDDLDGPGTATAYVLTRDRTTGEYAIGEEDFRTEFELYNFIQHWSGTGRNEEDPENIIEGTRGWCRFDNGAWEIVGSDGTAIILGTLAEDLTAGGDAEVTLRIGGDGTDTAYDDLLATGETLESGTKVVLARIAGKLYVIDASCAAS